MKERTDSQKSKEMIKDYSWIYGSLPSKRTSFSSHQALEESLPSKRPRFSHHRAREEKGAPFFVRARMIGDHNSKPAGLFINDDDANSHLLGQHMIKSRNLLFNYGFSLERFVHYYESCRDLVVFYGRRNVYVYSPSTNHYLLFHNPTCLQSHEFNVGIVYMSDLDSYKIVRLELLPGNRISHTCTAYDTLRFTSITVPEEGGIHTDHDPGTSSWELVYEHALPTPMFAGCLGNLIGVNGVVYACITFSKGPKTEETVISLDLKDDSPHPQFQILSLPPCCDDDKTTCRFSCKSRVLSQVKDLLCYPHTTVSTVDLWLLKDRNACSWFKGYTITSIPPDVQRVGPVVYVPHRTTKTAAADDDGDGAGLFLFHLEQRLFQHDLRTKETVCILEDSDNCNFLVVDDRQFFLKNGLQCSSLPTDKNSLQSHHPPTTGSLLPPLYSHPPPTKVSIPLPPPHSHPPLHQGLLPPPPSPYSHPPLPQHSLPPPPPPSYPCPPRPQGPTTAILPPQPTAYGIIQRPPPQFKHRGSREQKTTFSTRSI